MIFCTAHDEFALKAFEVHAVDYLLKPFDRERFQKALARAGERLRTTQRDELSSNWPPSSSSSSRLRPGRWTGFP